MTKTTSLVDVPEASQQLALQDVFRTVLPNFKLMSYEALAATVERMLLKRGFRIVPESKEERDERI